MSSTRLSSVNPGGRCQPGGSFLRARTFSSHLRTCRNRMKDENPSSRIYSVQQNRINSFCIKKPNTTWQADWEYMTCRMWRVFILHSFDRWADTTPPRHALTKFAAEHTQETQGSQLFKIKMHEIFFVACENVGLIYRAKYKEKGSKFASLTPNAQELRALETLYKHLHVPPPSPSSIT